MEDPQQTEATQEQTEKLIPQSQLNKIVQERIAREREKFADYDELKKFRSEYEQKNQLEEQKKLEEQQRYNELKSQWEQKESQYKTLLTEKEQAIVESKVTNSLSSEVLKQNAYPEAIDLLKGQAVYKDGKVFISGLDANGMATELSVEDGVKQFLSQRPYLVKVSSSKGSGTPPLGQGGTAGTAQQENLAFELQKAINAGDRAKVNQIKLQIQEKHSRLGIVR